MTGSISPCVYTGCRDLDGNPRLTTDTICDPSRGHYRRTLDRLREHWLVLHTLMPEPVRAPGERVVVKQGEKLHSHPREWASDQARAIARLFDDAHREVRQHTRAGMPRVGSSETARIRAAYDFLTARFHDLCTYPEAASTAAMFHNLNRGIRAGLGETVRRARVTVPCPRCELLMLVRVDDMDGIGGVECRTPDCGYTAPADVQEQWTRYLAASVLVTDVTDVDVF